MLVFLGVLSLFLLSSGCLESEIISEDVQNTHNITINTIEAESCVISVNGIEKIYDLPDVKNKIHIEGLQEGNNHIIITVAGKKAEFDINVPITSNNVINDDPYNTAYWKARFN
jgi:hypothetical protein